MLAHSARSSGTAITTMIRSDTLSPDDFRSSCNSRILSLTQPSASSSGVTVPSSTTSPAPSGRVAVYSGSAATSLVEYSSAASTTGPAVSVPSGLLTASPAFTTLIAAWTSLPSRGPATRALTVSSKRPNAVMSSVSSTFLTLSSSAISPVYGASREGSSTTTVNFGRGNRTRSVLALRSDEAAEHTSRTRSMSATSRGSAGRSPSDGQSIKCTDLSPVTPRQITSVVSGRKGAARREVTSSTVCSVSMASGSSSQNRGRDRRTYQFVNASVNCLSSSQAPEMSHTSSASVRSSRNWATLARM